MRRSILLFLGLYFSFGVMAQPLVPDKGPVFKDDVVPRIDILIDPQLLDEILAPGNEQSDVEHPATFIFDNGEIRDTVEQIGFRLRGNTSRFSAKKSFKVSFNTFEAGKDYKGLEKMNLNGEHNDPSIIRSKLCWDLLNDIGLPAPRANHIDLYINQEYFGLYINVEQIDEEFAELRFGDKSGNLFKCLYPADLDYRGPDGEDYKHSSNGRQVYELKTNEDEDNYDRLAEFIDIINNAPSEELQEQLEAVFNVNAYLKSLAAEIVTGHWDAYAYLKNNFYLYENPISGKIEFIHFDMDNTLGIDFLERDWGTRDIYNWANNGEPRPLYDRMVENPVYRERLTYYIRIILEQHFNPTVLNTKIDQIKAMIQASAEADPYRSLDWGFSIDDFNDSYDVALGGHVDYGLKDFISVKYTDALNQLENVNVAPIISDLSHNKVFIGQPILITATVEDEDDFSVVLTYNLNGIPGTLSMNDNGINGDTVAGDGVFTAELDGLIPPSDLSYHVLATDVLDQSSREPVVVDAVISLQETDALPLFINEFMADNENVIADEFGEFDDWFEIYNAGEEPIYLGDKFVTDNFLIPDKFRMPNDLIRAGEVLLFWADDDTNQGPFHTNFRLSADGEEIGIFYGEEFGFLPIHTVDFGPQNTDESMGYLPDGTDPLQILPFATPGRSNLVTGLEDTFLDKLKIFPNPTSNQLTIKSEHRLDGTELRIYGNKGEVLIRQRLSDFRVTLNISSLPPGLYLIHFHGEEGSFSHRLLKR